ncbi:hypothetical protein QAD02_019382 [Eretmocerus hayati]|uniref:Uncharacterized protein n=1 Tax=Eretmocerus hayati TaxID=131215 RepID=A0ACC2PJ13_9HYME|nr:hypothetical protein QAD02_019382 [Eretmocerus hayati]
MLLFVMSKFTDVTFFFFTDWHGERDLGRLCISQVPDDNVVHQNHVPYPQPLTLNNETNRRTRGACLSREDRKKRVEEYLQGYRRVKDGKKRPREYSWASLADVTNYYRKREGAGYADYKQRYIPYKGHLSLHGGALFYEHDKESKVKTGWKIEYK